MRALCLILLAGCSSSGLPTSGGTTTGGGTCSSNASCGAGDYCNFSTENLCGRLSSGHCTVRPSVCGKNFEPVCGCDGVSYDNPCLANQAGTTVFNSGHCPPPSGICGGESGSSCGAGEYCYFTPGQMCDWADGSGKCLPRPQACSDLYDPVCGCDSKDYSSECDAASAGVGTAYKGECGKPATDCRTSGCPSGKECTFCWNNYTCLPTGALC